jgi:hypothetical protein
VSKQLLLFADVQRIYIYHVAAERGPTDPIMLVQEHLFYPPNAVFRANISVAYVNQHWAGGVVALLSAALI